MFKNIIVKNYLECVRAVATNEIPGRFAIISLQDSDGFGFRFVPEKSCVDVMTLLVDDADTETNTFRGIQYNDKSSFKEDTKKLKLFSEEDAIQIVNFVEKNKDKIDTLVLHCFAGYSRSVGAAAAISKYYFNDDQKYFDCGCPNRRIYRMILNQFHS